MTIEWPLHHDLTCDENTFESLQQRSINVIPPECI